MTTTKDESISLQLKEYCNPSLIRLLSNFLTSRCHSIYDLIRDIGKLSFKYVVAIYAFHAITACHQRPKSEILNFYILWSEMSQARLDVPLEKILARMNKNDSNAISKELIEYDSNNKFKWLAKFNTTDKRMMIVLYDDGSVYLENI